MEQLIPWDMFISS